MLDPVLDRRVMRKGRGLTMQLADKEARQLRPCATMRVAVCRASGALAC